MFLERDKKEPVALAIAGFDPTGGAGIVADVKTFSALGCYGLSAATAITVQNTIGVKSISVLDPELVIDQLDALFNDFAIDAIKIGMLGNAEVALALAEFLKSHNGSPVVLDTPLYSSSGCSLFTSETQKIIYEKLFPLAAIITPNLPEAALLSGLKVNDLTTMKLAAEKLRQMGARSVLVKGGHLEDEPIDLLYNDDGFLTFHHERINITSAHGTGCALSSAIAALLAGGDSIAEAVAGAKEFVAGAILSLKRLGKGAGLLDHWAAAQNKKMD